MSGQVRKIVSRVCKGEVFVIPAGHPLVIVAPEQNVVAVGFGINASNSTRTFLAGKEKGFFNLLLVSKTLIFLVSLTVNVNRVVWFRARECAEQPR